MDIFAPRLIYFIKNMSNQIKISKSVEYFKIQLDEFTNNIKEKKLVIEILNKRWYVRGTYNKFPDFFSMGI